MNQGETMKKTGIALAIAALAATATTLPAQAAGSFTDALTGGKASVDFRLRNESVRQDNALDHANATTARLRLGYQTGEFKGFGAFVEAEHLTALGGEKYNSTVNNKATYSTVADPEFTEINQAYLSYSGIPKTMLKYGRQRIVLDNHRFIGNVGWRQNEQTYDAFTASNRSLPDTTITAGYIYNVNRVFSDESPVGNFKMKSPILNVNYKGLRAGELAGYAYLLDFETAPTSSTQTYGLRFKGATALGNVGKMLYTAEYATQADYADNTRNFNLAYYLLEGGFQAKPGTLKIGHEVLEGNGTVAFQTPLATLHAMNGWADQFLNTPVNGLKDTYVSASTSFAGIKLAAIYHDFRSERKGMRYGDEWDVVATKAIDKNYLVGLKYASYQAKDFSVDTDKFWLWLEAKF